MKKQKTRGSYLSKFIMMNKVTNRPNNGSLRRSGVGYIVGQMMICLVLAVILFAAAGTLSWIRGWIYFVYTLLAEVCTLIILAKKAPETLNQRGTTHPGVKTFDKVFNIAWLVISPITPMIAGVDAVRFGWSSMPIATLYVGAALLAVASIIITYAMVENEHFESLVRIQTDRKHRVVTTGPYRFVRHPGYAGGILWMVGIPLMLGSWLTFVPVGAVILLFIIRTTFEDQTLRRELEGYEAYARRTRFRLFPGIW